MASVDLMMRHSFPAYGGVFCMRIDGHSEVSLQGVTTTLDWHFSTRSPAADGLGAIYVADSLVAGTGVFAGREFTAGECILRFDDSRLITPEQPLRPELGETDDHVDHLANGALVYMQAPERYLNHCCEPNAFCRHFDGVRYLVARVDIRQGEEILVDYALNSAVPGYSWHCRCGASSCRETAHLDFFALPRALQLAYLPLLDHWFVTEHQARLAPLMALVGELPSPVEPRVAVQDQST